MIRMVSLLLLTACAHRSAPLVATSVVSEGSFLSSEERKELLDRFLASYQKVHGGFDAERRYLDPASIELGLLEASAGNEIVRGMVQKTLLKNVALIDRVGGGAYDWSDVVPGRHPWRSPNGKKSLRTQAINLRLYSMAHQVFGGHRHLDAAQLVYRYLDRELAAAGGGFVDLDRRMPTAENGLAISALIAYHRASGDLAALDAALSSAERMIAERMAPAGGFRGEEAGAISLEASVAMSEALAALHRATRDPRWLTMAQRSMQAVAHSFADPSGGFRGADQARSIEVNVAVARIGRELLDLTGNDGGVRNHAVRFLRSADVLSGTKDSAALLIANHRLRAGGSIARPLYRSIALSVGYR
jgi:uncharacterized protein YyaL (SSP411 family)